MGIIEDYVANIEGTCGQEKDIIVVLKFEKKDEAVAKILKNAQLKSAIGGGIIKDLILDDHSFRLYSSGKIIFRSIKNRETLNALITKLLT